MELSKKVKTALNEARMLILGGQILLGFQFRAVFAESYDRLPAAARGLDAAALALMICVIGLLIAPGPYHRIVERGEDSGRFQGVVSVMVGLALLPFAIALGFDLVVTSDRMFGMASAAAAGIAGTALALWFWYGFPRLRARRRGMRERAMASEQRDERAGTPLQVKIEQLLTEARVIIPGAQAMFGFQLAIVLTEAFERLPSASRTVHAASLFCVALAVVLLMAPAAYHRIVYAGEDTPDMHRVGSALVTMATIPLALGLAGDVYVVMAKIAGSARLGVAAAVLALVCLIGLWHVYPLVAAATGNRRRNGERS